MSEETIGTGFAPISGESAKWQQRKNAGCYVIGGNFYVYVIARPNWLARVMCRLLLQWEWRDAK